MEDADDVVGLVLPDGNARVLARQDLLDQAGRRVRRVQRLHLGPVHHDVEDAQILQVEDAAEHGRVLLRHRATLTLQLDGAADLLVRLENVGGIVALRRRQLQEEAHDRLDGDRERRQQRDQHAHDRRDEQGGTIGPGQRVGLRQDGREDDDQDRHDDGGVGDADVADELTARPPASAAASTSTSVLPSSTAPISFSGCSAAR